MSQKSEDSKTETTEEVVSELSEPKASSKKHCYCGYDRKHHMVSIVPTYTRWGAFWVTMMGVSATPTRIDFVCRICKKRFDREKDPAILKQFL
jgi:hypothetical protein